MFPTVTERTSEATLFSFFFRTRRAPRPPGALTSPASVSAHGWRSVGALTATLLPLPSSSSYLPAALDDRQPAARRPAAARNPIVSLRAPASFIPPARDLHGPASEFGRLFFFCFRGGNLSLCELCSQIALQDIWRKWPDLFL